MGLKDRVSLDGDLYGELPTRPADGVGHPAGQGIAYFKRKLLDEIDLSELVQLSPSQRRARLERVIGHLLSREGPVLSATGRRQLIRQIVDESLGLGVLEPLMADETITEIMVNGPEEIWIERDGRISRVEARFGGDTELMQTIDRIVSAVNRRVDESSPMVDARLPSGERVNVIIPPLALHGPTITIRRFPRAFTWPELISIGTVDQPTVELLGACVRARLSIIVSGGTATGKTTLLNALSAFVPENERIITIEDSAELQLRQPHVVSLEGRPANVEGKGEITIRDLVRNALRMRPDRIIVGEVRGEETLDMLQAMNTGHDGSISTVHANSTDDAIVRLETLASFSEVSIPFEALRDQINSAVDIVVQLERGADGRRRIVEVAAVASRQRESFRMSTLSRFDAEPVGVDRRVSGRYVHFPLPPETARRLMLAGESLPRRFADRADATAAPEHAPELER